MMDADRLGSYHKVLGRSLDMSKDAFAEDAYEEVASGGHFSWLDVYDAQLPDRVL